MMEAFAVLKFLAPIGAAFGAASVGASLYLTGIAGPLAFALFDYSRADRFNRMAIRSGHLKVAGIALTGATLALLGGSIGGAVSMGLGGTGLMLARFVVSPQKAEAGAGKVHVHHRGKKKKRVAALASTAIFLPPLLAGTVMALYGI